MSAPPPGQDPEQPFPGQQPYPPAQPYPPGHPYPGQQPYPGQSHPPGQQPYPGQSHPPGQQPYPRQQPLPPGRRTNFGTALLATLVWPAVNLVLTLAIVGPPPSAEAGGAFTGALLIPTLLAALVTWLIARRRPAPWKFPLLVLLALPFYLFVRVIAAAGSAAG